MMTLIAALLVLGIAAFYVRQGVYAALVNTVIVLAAIFTAFNFYEPLAALVLYLPSPGVADAAVLLALFFLSWLVLRIVRTLLLKPDMRPPVWIDRIGGGVVGLVLGILLTGMLAIILQMLPMERSVLGYEPYDAQLERDAGLPPFFPDDFVVGLVKTASAGSLSGARPYAARHPELLRELFAWRNTAGKNGAIIARPATLEVRNIWDPADPNAPMTVDTEAVPESPQVGGATRVIALRVAVQSSAAKSDGWLFAPGTHFRLMTESGQALYPVAHLAGDGTPQTPWTVEPAPGEDDPQLTELIVQKKVPGKARWVTLTWLYRLAEDDKPVRLTFRRLASQPMPKKTSWPEPGEDDDGDEDPPDGDGGDEDGQDADDGEDDDPDAGDGAGGDSR